MDARSFLVSVPADPRFLRSVRSFFQPLIEDVYGETDGGMVVLALDEACSSIIKHCNAGLQGRRITVSAELDGGGVKFRISDFCRESDVPNIKPRDLNEPRPGGLGTHFISKIMDRVAFEPETGKQGRLALVLEKAAPNTQK